MRTDAKGIGPRVLSGAHSKVLCIWSESFINLKFFELHWNNQLIRITMLDYLSNFSSKIQLILKLNLKIERLDQVLNIIQLSRSFWRHLYKIFLEIAKWHKSIVKDPAMDSTQWSVPVVMFKVYTGNYLAPPEYHVALPTWYSKPFMLRQILGVNTFYHSLWLSGWKTRNGLYCVLDIFYLQRVPHDNDTWFIPRVLNNWPIYTYAKNDKTTNSCKRTHKMYVPHTQYTSWVHISVCKYL